MNTTKRCLTCDQDKPCTEFVRRKRNKDGYRARCKMCFNAALQERGRTSSTYILHKREQGKRFYRARYERCLVAAARKRARKRGTAFSITETDIYIPTHCPILGTQLVVGNGRVGPDSPTIDEVVPQQGYVRGNVQVISHRANTMKSNATPDELLRFAQWVGDTFVITT